MTLVAGRMRAISIAAQMPVSFPVMVLILLLLLAAPAWAGHEAGSVGPYNVSFDMNTTMLYKVLVDEPSQGVTAGGVSFTRYNLTIDSADYTAYLILTRYDQPILASINNSKEIVIAALLSAGAKEPKLYQPLINGQPGVLGSFRFERQYLGQGAYQQGDIVVAASYSPDGAVRDDGLYRGRTDCRVISTYPWEITRDLIYTLNVAAPED